jgi:hypothetical protein
MIFSVIDWVVIESGIEFFIINVLELSIVAQLTVVGYNFTSAK